MGLRQRLTEIRFSPLAEDIRHGKTQFIVLLYLRHNNPCTKADLVDFMARMFSYQERRSCLVSISRILDELAAQKLIRLNGAKVYMQISPLEYVLNSWFMVTLPFGVMAILFSYLLTGFSLPTILATGLTGLCILKLVEEILRIKL